jgi:hypothetical protein
MKKNQLILSILLVGIAFGTAWAIRGQFGHEPGAAFAGIIGVAALLLVAGRQDWYNKMLPIIAAGAIGWGTTGMISYGIVVGYCRAEDLLNSTYGFLSLFVIGSLFGLIGGGSGMAYGVFTSVWPTGTDAPKKYENSLSLMVILLIVPLLVWKDAFLVSDLMKSNFIQNDASKALFLTLLTFAILVAMNLVVRLKLIGKTSFDRSEVMILFLVLFSTYIVWSYLITGLLMGNFRSEQPLYVLNLIAFLVLVRKSKSHFQSRLVRKFYPKDRWALYFGLTLAIILLFPLISQLMHSGIPNANMRFPVQP